MHTLTASSLGQCPLAILDSRSTSTVVRYEGVCVIMMGVSRPASPGGGSEARGVKPGGEREQLCEGSRTVSARAHAQSLCEGSRTGLTQSRRGSTASRSLCSSSKSSLPASPAPRAQHPRWRAEG
eukprot:762397-Rhodomonas_salina.2